MRRKLYPQKLRSTPSRGCGSRLSCEARVEGATMVSGVPMKTWRWCALAGCGALLCAACGSAFSASEGGEDAGSTDGGVGHLDGSASDGSTSDGADQPDAAQDGSPDGGNAEASDTDACGPGVSSAVCVAAMEQITACSGGTIGSCDCTYLKGSCETLAGDLSDA